jgi:glycosyltransferase involved in cell wall biosynthesis
MKPIVSIVIPCYNSGKYLPDALHSIEVYQNTPALQIIIVDDGSKDAETHRYLETLDHSCYKVIYQDNRGPAAARNTGVAVAESEFLLFLDSDNKIRPEYIDRGIEVLTAKPDVGVVYGNAEFFGKMLRPRFKSGPFDISTLLKGNYIDVCSMVRKKAFDDIGGFDESRILFGHEDWELWIRMFTKGWNFQYLNQTLFDYRVRENSLLMQKSEEDNLRGVLRYVYKKHIDLFITHYELLRYQYEFYNNDKNKPFRTFLKYFYHKYFKKKQETSA